MLKELLPLTGLQWTLVPEGGLPLAQPRSQPRDQQTERLPLAGSVTWGRSLFPGPEPHFQAVGQTHTCPFGANGSFL